MAPGQKARQSSACPGGTISFAQICGRKRSPMVSHHASDKRKPWASLVGCCNLPYSPERTLTRAARTISRPGRKRTDRTPVPGPALRHDFHARRFLTAVAFGGYAVLRSFLWRRQTGKTLNELPRSSAEESRPDPDPPRLRSRKRQRAGHRLPHSTRPTLNRRPTRTCHPLPNRTPHQRPTEKPTPTPKRRRVHIYPARGVE